MRTLTLFTLLFSLTLFYACDDDIAIPTKSIDLLPPATQEGNYTFGCLVNGEAFVTESSTDIVAIYQAGFLQLHANLQSMDQNISILINDPIINESIYTLNDLKLGRGKFHDQVTNCEYQTNTHIKGKLSVDLIDKANYIISGTFNMMLVSNQCSDTIRVTNGRFDTHYIP